MVYKVRFLSLVVFAMLAGVWPIAAQAASVPNLGSAANFAVLGASAVTCTTTVPSSVIGGDVGVSPNPLTSITGFPPCTGTIASAAVAAQAQSDALVAYEGLVDARCTTVLTGDLGGQTLSPGVYCFSSSAQLTGILTLSGAGVYIFQIGSTITTASDSKVVMASGAVCGNVFWQVGSSATLGTDSAFAGNILALASITMNTGATLDGRAIALTAAVTMDDNTVSACAAGTGHGNGHRTHCNQGVGNGPEGCDPGNSNNKLSSNDELINGISGTPGDPGRQGGNGK